MDGLTTKLPEDLAELIALVQKQQAQLASSEKRNERLQKKLQSKDNTIEKLEERLRALLIHRFRQTLRAHQPQSVYPVQ